MDLGFVADQAERRTKFGVQRLGRVAHHIQPRTLQGAAGTEGRDNDMPAGFDALQHLRDITCAVFRIGQKMKYRAIVPDIVVRGGQISPGDIARNPLYRLRPRPKRARLVASADSARSSTVRLR